VAKKRKAQVEQGEERDQQYPLFDSPS